MPDKIDRNFADDSEDKQEVRNKSLKSKRDPIDTRVFTPEETREAFRESREAFEKEQKNKKKSGL